MQDLLVVTKMNTSTGTENKDSALG